MTRGGWFSALGVLGALGIAVGVNLAADARLDGRLDATQGRLYTLSPGTRTVLGALREPITLRLFFSRALGAAVPAYGAYADRVRAMLAQYAARAHGNIRLEFYDPEPFSDTEDRALAAGLQGVPLDQNGEQVFFGIAGSNLLDDDRQIAFLQPNREPFLEYDLTRLVYDLSNPTRPVIGVMSPLPLDGDPRAMMMAARGMADPAAQPWQSMQLLRSTYTVKTVPLDAQRIDPSVQVLLVAQPQRLADAALYAIDQFVMRGGRLMLMLDPASEAQAHQAGPDGAPPRDTSSDLHRLLDAWGISFDPNQVVGDLTGAWRVRADTSGRMQAVDYLPWFNVRDGIAPGDPALADVQQVTVASAGTLAPKTGAAIEWTPILQSSTQSELIPAAQVRQDPDPARILAAFQPQGGPFTLAARVRGALHSAFTGPPDLPNGTERDKDLPPHRVATDGPANLVVVADSDILADRTWVRQNSFFGQGQAEAFSDNGPFVSDLLGSLAGGDALIGLRSRGDSQRPFTVVQAMQGRAEARFRRTQQDLQAHLDETQKKLQALRGTGDASQAVITAAQRDEIDAARRDIAQTRRQLRGVQLDLNRDIARLQTGYRMLDIAAVPALLALVALVLGLARLRRRGAARA